MATERSAVKAVDNDVVSRAASSISALLGRPVCLEMWDGSRAHAGGGRGPADTGNGQSPPAAGAAITIRLRSRHAIDRLLGARPERAFGRAYGEGLIEVEPLEELLDALAGTTTMGRLRSAAAVAAVVRSAIALGGRPDARRLRDLEASLHGRRHSRERDAQAISHHYDLPEEFYRLWLDRTLTYSCAHFAGEDDDIDTAQRAKLDLVCRKLRLRAGERVLDVGCGWGSFAIHAAEHHGVDVVGITLSRRQAEAARRRVAERGLQSRVTIRLADYRDPLGEPFDAIASIGMVEHVGGRRLDDFAAALHRAVRPGGRVLLHGIVRPGRAGSRSGSFIESFVFPDGELQPIWLRDGRMEEAGFELRDGESLREHYALTLRRWVDGLREHWSEAVAIVGEPRTRVWLLYLTGSMVGFRRGTVSVHQSLFVRPDAEGRAHLPLRRDDWYGAAGQAHMGTGVSPRERKPSSMSGSAATV